MSRSASNFHWIGGTVGNESSWATTANWKKDDGTVWSDGSYPGWDGTASAYINNDSVYFDLETSHGVNGINLDLSTFNKVVVTPVFTKTIGTTLEPLKIMSSTNGELIVDAKNAGNIYISGQGTTTNYINNVSILSSNGNVYLGGGLANLTLFGGNVTLITNAYVNGIMSVGTNDQSVVTLTLETGVTLPSTVQVMGGSVTCNSTMDTLQLFGGTFTSNSVITTLIVKGGVFDWTAGNITTARVYGGLLDGSKSKTSRTITTAYLYPQGSINVNNGTRTAKITNLYLDTEGFVMLKVTPNQKISIT